MTAATLRVSGSSVIEAGGHQLVDGEAQRHPRARDRGGAGAAIGLDHVAIEHDLAFAQLPEIGHGAQRTADQALDFLGAARLLALGRFAAAARVGGAGQHRIFGRHPAFALAAQERGHLFLDTGGAPAPGIAEADQHRAFGMLGEVGLEREARISSGARPEGRMGFSAFRGCSGPLGCRAASNLPGRRREGRRQCLSARAERLDRRHGRTPITELTDRAREIFRLVVEGYLSRASRWDRDACRRRGINLSPASIRSVLADLESLGLLAAPHTSAGRMPTEMGLRLFVDGMMQVAEPTAEERAAIERRLSEPGPIEAALAATSAVLSDLSACAGLVMVPRREPRLAQFSLVPLAPGRALAVLVGEDGAWRTASSICRCSVRPGALEEASNYITARLAGRTLAEAVRAMRTAEIASGQSALDAASRDLVERGFAVWSEDATQRPVLIVRGQANLLDESR
jgi:heat-inducible transcriptional repressor